MKFNFSKKIMFMALACMAFIVGGIGYYYKAHAQDSAGESNETIQAMPVKVTVIQPEAVQIWKEFSARLEAVEYAEIRPQVSGVIKEVKFKDGQMVEKGDVLFVIDPRPYKAEVDRAQSELNATYNEIKLAEKELNRAQNLIKVDAISERIYDERLTALDVAKSKSGSAKAQLEQAKINLDYAYVNAPISGQVGREEVKVGNLVDPGPNAPLLTTIVSDKGIYADFEIDEQTYVQQVRVDKTVSIEADDQTPVKMTLNASDKVYDGYVHSFDNRIDSTSGTIRARAYFSNEDGVLLPGMFASIEIGSADIEKQILITEKAIGTDQSRKFVFVVNDENKVTYRPIQIGESMNGQRVVLSGLNKGDKVITEGVIRIRPDMIVDPQVVLREPKMDKVIQDKSLPITSAIPDDPNKEL